MTRTGVSPLAAFTPAERRLIRRLRTPDAVQRYLNRLALQHRAARRHAAELPAGGPAWHRALPRSGAVRGLRAGAARLSAAADDLRVGRRPRPRALLYRKRGRWGTVARSRDPGLHGRKPVFRTLRALTMSYFDAYIDPTGCIEGYAPFDLTQARALRLAVRAQEHVGGRARADRHSAPIGSSCRASASRACARAMWPIARNTERSRCSIAAGGRGPQFPKEFL